MWGEKWTSAPRAFHAQLRVRVRFVRHDVVAQVYEFEHGMFEKPFFNSNFFFNNLKPDTFQFTGQPSSVRTAPHHQPSRQTPSRAVRATHRRRAQQWDVILRARVAHHSTIPRFISCIRSYNVSRLELVYTSDLSLLSA